MKLKVILYALFLFLTVTGEICSGKEADAISISPQIANSSPRIVNIINFIRQCEPRIDWITEEVLYDTVAEGVVWEDVRDWRLVGDSATSGGK